MTKRAKPREFYVYMYLRTRSSEYGAKGSPYYIGKGSRNRRFDSCHRVKPPKDPGCNILVAYGLTESEAHQEEIRLIGEYGRIDLGTGCLRNQTNGGEGTSGWVASQQTRERMSIVNCGKKMSSEAIEKTRLFNLGRPLSVETKEKLRTAHSGKKLTPEHIEHARLAKVGVKQSPKAIEQSRQARKGQKRSLESRQRMSLAARNKPNSFAGKTHSVEAKAKMRVAKLGTTLSPEIRLKMSEAQKHRWALKKGSQ